MASRTRVDSRQPAGGSRRRRSPWIRRIKIALVLGFIGILTAFCAVWLMFMGAIRNAHEQMGTIESKFEQVARPASRILTADGVELFREAPENRIPLKFSEIPKHVRQAIIAAEDKRFYEHNGVDAQGIGRAFWNLFSRGHVAGGGSTITMQLAKRLYNGNAVSFRRKMDDIAFAYEIERTVANKNRILELYMNQVYFGEGAYGIGAAARIYLNKNVSQLTISEAAMLARCVRMPNRENPIHNIKVAIENRDHVLEVMRDEHMITDDEYAKALEEQPKINKHPQRTTAAYTAGYGQYFVRHVLEVMEQDNPGIDFKGGGVTVYTTINSHLQRRAEETVRAVVAENRAKLLNQGAFVAMDHEGKILCEVGGVDWQKNQWNIVTQSHLLPGSGFKPFLYATALREGAIHMDDTLSNAPIRIKDGDHYWEPKNSSPRENAPSYSLANAIALSINRPAIYTILKVSPQTVVQYAHDYFGFRSPMHAYPSLAIGTCQVTPLEMLEGYSVFMLRGDRVRPYPITRIESSDGQVLKDYYPQRFAGVFDPGTCDEMDQLLQGVVQHGTGSAANVIPDARGKTGTTNDAKDAWFNGYADGIVGVAWVGNEKLVKGQWKQLPMSSATFGGTTAVYIWRDVMKEAIDSFGHKPAPVIPQVDENRVAAINAKDKPKDGAVPNPPLPPDAITGTDPNDPMATTGSDAGPPGTGDTAGGKTPPPDRHPLPPDSITPQIPNPTQSPTQKTQTPDTDLPAPDIDNPASKPAKPTRPAAAVKQKMVTVEVCLDTGDLATPYCPSTVTRQYAAGKQPKKYCTLHHPPQ